MSDGEIEESAARDGRGDAARTPMAMAAAVAIVAMGALLWWWCSAAASG